MSASPVLVSIHHCLSQITIIDVNDECVLSNRVKKETHKYYPDARLASLKDGGNFPYLSRSGEVNVFLRVG